MQRPVLKRSVDSPAQDELVNFIPDVTDEDTAIELYAEDDDAEPFNIEVEQQQCALTLELLKILEATVKDINRIHLQELGLELSRATSFLHEYRRGLADTTWVSNRLGQFHATSEALQTLLLSDDERDLDDAIRSGRLMKLPELTAATEALSKLLEGGRQGNGSSRKKQGCCGGGGCGNHNNDLAKQGKTAGVGKCGGSGGCQGGNCSSGNIGNISKEPADLSSMVAQCTTLEQQWALRDKIVEQEVAALLAANKHLVSVPETRRNKIKRDVEAAIDDIIKASSMQSNASVSQVTSASIGGSACSSTGKCVSCPSQSTCPSQANQTESPAINVSVDGSLKLSVH